MGKKDKQEQVTGTVGGGVSFSRPLATGTEDGARIVYVAVPNEDTLRITAEYQEKRIEREPRINALTTVIGLRQFGMSDKTIEDVLAEAAKVEEYIRNGTVPAKAEGPAETEEEAD